MMPGKKILAGVIIAIFVLISINYVAYQTIILDNYAKLEEKIARENVNRALSAISDDLSDLDVLTHDWAKWDEPYQFIKEENEERLYSIFDDNTFINCKLNLVIYYDTKGRMLFSKAYDLENRKKVPIPQSFYKMGINDPLIYVGEGKSLNGIINIPEGLMLVSSKPVLTSDGEKPVLGKLIFGRYLDDEDILEISEKTHLSIKAFSFSKLPQEYEEIVTYLMHDSVYLQKNSEESIEGFGLVNDIYGEPVLLVKVDMPRDIYVQGQKTITYFMLTLVAISFIFGIVFWVLFEKYIIAEEIQKEAIEQLVTNLCQFDNSADRLRNPLGVIMGALELKEELGTDRVLKTVDEQVKKIKEELDELRKEEINTYNLTKEVLEDL